MKFILFHLFLVLFIWSSFGQKKEDIPRYIERYKQVAIDEMVRTKIPASITLAQGIFESGAGASPLARNTNNHFGIKCKGEWSGEKYYHDDDNPQECFRVYEHAEASYADHSDFLLIRPRYMGLFQLPILSYKYWALGLKEAGYATNPKYATMLIAYIEDYKLYEFDKIGLAMIEEREYMMTQPKDDGPILVQGPAKSERVFHKESIAEPKKEETRRPEFIVNGLRVLKAKGNEDPFKVAFEYDIDFSSILSFNELSAGERFKDGENIFLQEKRNKGESPDYIVQTGESMRDISQKTGIKLKELYQKNSMKLNDQVYEKETISLQENKKQSPLVMTYAEYLKVQNKNTTSARVQNKVHEDTTVTPNDKELVSSTSQERVTNTSEYQVQQSDTLYSIAKKFNTSVEKLKVINNLETTDLKAGQTIVVSM